jgi:hypothetical protein
VRVDTQPLRLGKALLVMALALCAACSGPGSKVDDAASVAIPPQQSPASRADAALAANCQAFEPSYEWQRSDPPAASVRSLYTVPAGAPSQLWFLGRSRAVALCTPCTRGGTAVKSFEWYEPGFRKGELKLQKCGGAAR